jgi:hypothetical protein
MSQVFRCPSCHEIISLGVSSCRFCSTPIDHRVAQVEAEKLGQITQACAQANQLKHGNAIIPLLLLLQAYLWWTSSMPGIGAKISWISLGGPIIVIGWFVKYGRLQTDDPDFHQAKKAMKLSLMLWIGVVIVQIAVAWATKALILAR